MCLPQTDGSRLVQAMAHAAYLEAEVNSGKYDINAKVCGPSRVSLTVVVCCQVRFVEWLKLASKDNATEDEKASVGENSHQAAIECSVRYDRRVFDDR